LAPQSLKMGKKKRKGSVLDQKRKKKRKKKPPNGLRIFAQVGPRLGGVE